MIFKQHSNGIAFVGEPGSDSNSGLARYSSLGSESSLDSSPDSESSLDSVMGSGLDSSLSPYSSSDSGPDWRLAEPTSQDYPDLGKYVNPFTDFGFKRIFGQPISKDILIDFLNEVLAGREATITDLTYLNNELVPKQKNQRRAVFDLHCKTSTGARCE